MRWQPPRSLPLKALATFGVAARHLSFTVAATELNVSRVAVSQQIKLLEEFLQVALFVRKHRSLRLTREGETLVEAVAGGLDRIREGVQKVRNPYARNRVTVTTSTGFATYWLLPRIGTFRRLHSDIDLQLLVSDSYLDLTNDGVDIAIRYGDGSWPGVKSKFLVRERIFPVCSPAYLRSTSVPRSPKDLLLHRLVHLEGRYDPDTRWEVWFKKQGIFLDEPLRGIRVNAYTNLVQAALDGLGIALMGPPAISQLLWKGSLVPLFRRRATKRRAFFLCVPSSSTLSPAAQTFFDWVQREIKKRRTSLNGHDESRLAARKSHTRKLRASRRLRLPRAAGASRSHAL